jgi:hypothetical protein
MRSITAIVAVLIILGLVAFGIDSAQKCIRACTHKTQCPLRPESNGIAARQPNDATGHEQTHAPQQKRIVIRSLRQRSREAFAGWQGRVPSRS